MRLDKISIKKILLFLVISSLVITIVQLWRSNSLYRFEVHGSDDYILLKDVNYKKTEVTTFFGISIIPKDTNFIEVSSSSMLTRHSLTDKPWFGIKEEDIALQSQYEVDKLGMEGIGCDLRLSSDSKPYSYSCSNPQSPILEFANKKELERSNTVSYDKYLYALARGIYPDGMLYINLSGDEQATISHINPDGEIIKEKELDKYHRFRLFSNSISKMFMIYDTQDKNMLIYKDGLDGDFEERSMSELSGSDEDLILSDCSISNGQYACFFTTPHSNHDHSKETIPNQSHYDAPKDGVLVIQNDTNHVVQDVHKAFSKICLRDGIITAQNEDYLYNLDVNKPQEVGLLDYDVRSLNCDGDAIAYTKSNEVLQVEGLSSYLLFNIDRFSISNINTQQDGSILFNTYIASTEDSASNQKLHSYAINKEKIIIDTSKRLEHLLPYNIVGMPIFDMDYNNDAIYINPRISVISDHQTGQTIVDQDELGNTKKIIEDKLRQDGLLDRLDIVYY